MLFYDRRRPDCLGVRYPSGAHDRIFFTPWQLRVCWLGLLWRENRSVIYACCWSEPRKVHSHVLQSQIWDSPNPEGQVPVFISPGAGWPNYTRRNWVQFSSPLMARRVTVEIFNPPPRRAWLACPVVPRVIRVGSGMIQEKTHFLAASVVKYGVEVATDTHRRRCFWNYFLDVWRHWCRGKSFIAPLPSNMPRLSVNMPQYLDCRLSSRIRQPVSHKGWQTPVGTKWRHNPKD
jgi:hypothetical protein